MADYSNPNFTAQRGMTGYDRGIYGASQGYRGMQSQMPGPLVGGGVPIPAASNYNAAPVGGQPRAWSSDDAQRVIESRKGMANRYEMESFKKFLRSSQTPTQNAQATPPVPIPQNGAEAAVPVGSPGNDYYSKLTNTPVSGPATPATPTTPQSGSQWDNWIAKATEEAKGKNFGLSGDFGKGKVGGPSTGADLDSDRNAYIQARAKQLAQAAHKEALAGDKEYQKLRGRVDQAEEDRVNRVPAPVADAQRAAQAEARDRDAAERDYRERNSPSAVQELKNKGVEDKLDFEREKHGDRMELARQQLQQRTESERARMEMRQQHDDWIQKARENGTLTAQQDAEIRRRQREADRHERILRGAPKPPKFDPKKMSPGEYDKLSAEHEKNLAAFMKNTGNASQKYLDEHHKFMTGLLGQSAKKTSAASPQGNASPGNQPSAAESELGGIENMPRADAGGGWSMEQHAAALKPSGNGIMVHPSGARYRDVGDRYERIA